MAGEMICYSTEIHAAFLDFYSLTTLLFQQPFFPFYLDFEEETSKVMRELQPKGSCSCIEKNGFYYVTLVRLSIILCLGLEKVNDRDCKFLNDEGCS